MPPSPVILTFANSSAAEASQLAESLAERLHDIDPRISVERQPERSDSQDFGASLAVVLGTAAATAVAKGISAWLTRNSGARLEIKCKEEVVMTATHLDSRDIARIVSALSGCK